MLLWIAIDNICNGAPYYGVVFACGCHQFDLVQSKVSLCSHVFFEVDIKP